MNMIMFSTYFNISKQMEKKVLLVTTFFPIFLILYSLYKEQKYLLLTNTLYIDYGSTTYLHILIILSSSLIITCFLTFVLKTKHTKYIYIANYSYFLLIQFLCLIYGYYYISSSISKMGQEWGKINSNRYTSLAEKTMQCCGFYDTLESTSDNCTFSIPCSNIILSNEYYRKLSFLLFVSISIVFQIYNIFGAVFLIKFENELN